MIVIDHCLVKVYFEDFYYGLFVVVEIDIHYFVSAIVGARTELSGRHRRHPPGSDHKEEVSGELPAGSPAPHLRQVHGSHGAGEEWSAKGHRYLDLLFRYFTYLFYHVLLL